MSDNGLFDNGAPTTPAAPQGYVHSAPLAAARLTPPAIGKCEHSGRGCTVLHCTVLVL